MARTFVRFELVVVLVAAQGCGGCDDDPPLPSGTPIVQRIESADQLIPGLQASGRVGDYLLANDKARFIVEEAGSSTGWGIFGGGLVDLGGPAGQPADDRLQQLFVQCDLRAFKPNSVEIVNDGRDGQPGVLRFVGEDAGIPVLDAIIVRDPLNVQITVDYVLAPGSDSLELIMRVKDLQKTVEREIACGLIMLRGDQGQAFIEGIGDDETAAGGKQPYIASAAFDSPTSWVLYRDGAELEVILALAEVVPIAPRGVPFLANATIEERYRVGVGARGDIESALEIVRRANGDPIERHTHSIRYQLPAAVRAPISELVVTVTSSTAQPAAITSVKADDQGVVRLPLAAGRYQVEALLHGRFVDRSTFEVAATDTSEERALRDLGAVVVEGMEVDLQDRELGPTSVRAFLIVGHDQTINGPRYHQEYLRPGDSFFARAGDYTLVASRGPGHELSFDNVTLGDGETVTVRPRLKRSVDLGDWVTQDSHIHSTKSVDSQAARRLRAIGAVAEGVMIMVGTDHDAVIDYAPTIEALGLAGKVRPVVGCEMSMLYGHMNGYPLELPNGREAYYSPFWPIYEEGRYVRQRDPHEVADLLRASGAEIVQVNHPRDGQGVFGYLGLDPVTAATTKPWPNVQAVELLNGKRLQDYEAVRADFFNLIGNGKKVTAVGTSDSHSEYSGLGYARTLIKGPGGALAELDLSAVWANLAAGRAVAVEGPYAWLTARQGALSAEIGDTMVATGPIQLEVKIAAATHIKVDRFTIYENGQPLIVRQVTLADADLANPAIRFMGTVTATVTRDAHYELEVGGGDNSPFFDDSITFTNPIYLDPDGNGFGG